MAWWNRIRGLRLKAGLTEKELGEKLGLAESTISNIERGTRKSLKDINAQNFARAFDMPFESFIRYIHSDTLESGVRISGYVRLPVKGEYDGMRLVLFGEDAP